MSKITQEIHPTDELGTVNRAQIEHRATWLGLIYDEMVKAGIDAEPILRKAVRRCGGIHGSQIRRACKDPHNCQDFRQAFLQDLGIKTFEMRPITGDQTHLKIDFHYCALVEAWQKLGFDDETCDVLCDIAMEGDRGIAEVMGLQLELTDRIAQGCQVCKLHFHQ